MGLGKKIKGTQLYLYYNFGFCMAIWAISALPDGMVNIKMKLLIKV